MSVFRGIKISGKANLRTTTQISLEIVVGVMWLRT